MFRQANVTDSHCPDEEPEDMKTDQRHVTAREGFPQDVLDELEAAVDAFLRIAGHNPD